MGIAKKRKELGLPNLAPYRREKRTDQRADLAANWSVYHPLEKGVPIRKREMEALAEAPAGTMLTPKGDVVAQYETVRNNVVIESPSTGDETVDALLGAALAKASV